MTTAQIKFLLGYNMEFSGGMNLWWGESAGGIFLVGWGEKWANFQVVGGLPPISPSRENPATWEIPLHSNVIWKALHTGANGLSGSYEYVLTPPLLCSHSSCLYCIEWIICWYQKLTLQSSTMSLLFKNYSPAEVTYLD